MNSKTPIKSASDIVQFFHNAAVPRNELLIGLEVERSGVYNKDMSPVSYAGSSGYLAILHKLVEEVGWKIIDQDTNGNIKAIKRGGSEIHIEDDGRLELVSKPRKGLFTLCREYQMHIREINEISEEFGVRWVSMGRQPFATNKEITYIFPSKIKSCHNHYQKHYPDWEKKIITGWEKKDNSIHVNIGYSSEEDAIEKFQTLLKISPILTAVFANSPLNVKKFSGFLANRAHNTSLICPHRTQIQKIFFEKNFNFARWVNFLLELPMRRIDRKGEQIFIPLSFCDYLKNGFQKYSPRIEDFYLHIKSFWGEVRIKNYLEYRGIDCVPPHLLPSIPALMRAVTLNPDVMQECQNLVKDWTFTDHLEMREKVYKHALQAETPNGGKMIDFAKELLNIASFSLTEQHKRLKDRIDASRFLRPIKEYVFVREQSPAEYVMEMWNGEWHRNPRKLLEWSEK